MRRLPAEIMFAQLHINAPQWLNLTSDQKDRLITVYLNGHQAFVPLAARQTIAMGADEYARYMVRPAGDAMANFSIGANAGGGGDTSGSGTSATSTGGATASTGTGSGDDQWLKLLNTFLATGIPAALQIYNGLNATDQARIQSEAQQNVARIQATGAQTQQDQQALALYSALANQKQGMSTGTIIALVAGGVVLVGGIAYLALRPRRNPVIRVGGRKKFVSAAHARSRRNRRRHHRAS